MFGRIRNKANRLMNNILNQGCEFLSAKALGIEHAEWEALIKTLWWLEHGKLPHTEVENPTFTEFFAYSGTDTPKIDGFNMLVWSSRGEECGTVCCIGGTASHFLGRKITMNHSLFDLFHPYEISNWSKITPVHAAHALRNYLTTGRAQWKKAIKRKT